jgi:hypothetical protein
MPAPVCSVEKCSECMISESKQLFFSFLLEERESPAPKTHTPKPLEGERGRVALRFPEPETEAVEPEPGAPAHLQVARASERAHLSHQRDPGRSAPWPGARRAAPAGGRRHARRSRGIWS